MESVLFVLERRRKFDLEWNYENYLFKIDEIIILIIIIENQNYLLLKKQ